MKVTLLIAGFIIAAFLCFKLGKGGQAYFHGFKAGYRKGCADEVARIKSDIARVMGVGGD